MRMLSVVLAYLLAERKGVAMLSLDQRSFVFMFAALPLMLTALTHPGHSQSISEGHHAAAERMSMAASGGSSDEVVAAIISELSQQMQRSMAGLPKERQEAILNDAGEKLRPVYKQLEAKQIEFWTSAASESDLTVLAREFGQPPVQRALRIPFELIFEGLDLIEKANDQAVEAAPSLGTDYASCVPSLLKHLDLDKWVNEATRDVGAHTRSLGVEAAAARLTSFITAKLASALTTADCNQAAAFFGSDLGQKGLELRKAVTAQMQQPSMQALNDKVGGIISATLSRAAALKQ
jgi:hypothetical protein